MTNNFLWQTRVYYEDTDAGGIVYYANYLKYFERARTEWLRSKGIEQQQMAKIEQLMFVVKNIHVDYYAPARLDDQLSVSVEVESIKSVSLYLLQKIWHNTTLLTACRVKIGCVHTLSLKPHALPPEVKTSISA